MAETTTEPVEWEPKAGGLFGFMTTTGDLEVIKAADVEDDSAEEEDPR